MRRKTSGATPPLFGYSFNSLDRGVDLIEYWIEQNEPPGATPRYSIRISLDQFVFRIHWPEPKISKAQMRDLLKQQFEAHFFESLKHAAKLIEVTNARLTLFRSVLGGVCFDIMVKLRSCPDGMLQALRRLETRVTSSEAVEFSFEAYRDPNIYRQLIQPVLN